MSCIQSNIFLIFVCISIEIIFVVVLKPIEISDTSHRSFIILVKWKWSLNIDVCKTLMRSFPKIKRIGLTFDLDLWPTDLNINRGHLLIKDFLPTKFEASGAKHSWVISCTRWSRLAWPLTLTFDLLTWISIGVIYSSRTIYLPSLKLLGGKCSWAISCRRWRRLAWPLTLTFDLLTWISIVVIYSSRTMYLPSLKLLGQSVLELSVALGEVDWHDLWPWPLTNWPEYQ